ncbi:hypothetical protein [Deinococcus marmoris]|uniref:Uncharacterized protein n=1 Tax=Deinococcus marmoris TaxID=249408 RepID=A0A1U7NZH2_9DEIO|nr:hypothetical protein [Deinococcus marmoris]OLV18321.1 hypothetical protein BOO71_0006058 [Deinococcus marmoris]
MTKNDSEGERGSQPTPSVPEGLPQRTLPGVPAPSGTGMSAGQVTGLLGGDASMTEANLALETGEGVDPTAES